MARYKSDYIEANKKLLSKFDDLSPKNGKERNIKVIADRCNQSIDNLQASCNDLDDIFKMTQRGYKKAKKEHAYPTAVKNVHITTATIIGAAILTAAYLGFNFMLGGSNVASWSNGLIWTSAAVGIVPSIPAAIVTYVANKKNFDREAIRKSKFRILEKMALKRAEEKEYAYSLIALEIEEHREEIIKGDYDIYETERVRTRGGKYKDVVKYKEGFDVLSKRERKRLTKLIESIKEENQILDNNKSRLEKAVNEIKAERRKEARTIPPRKTTPQVKPNVVEEVEEAEEISSTSSKSNSNSSRR